MFDIVGRRYLFFAVSLIIIIPGLIALLWPGWGLKPSIDFTGGTSWEVVPSAGVTTDQIASAFTTAGYETVVQPATITGNGVTTNTMIIRTVALKDEDQQKLTELLVGNNLVPGSVVTSTVANVVTATATTTAGATPAATTTATSGAAATTGTTTTTRTTINPNNQIQYNTVGPAIGAEVQEKAVYAVIAASLGILAYLWYAFRRVPNPIRYGVCAVIALLHDALVVLGVFAILGKLFGLEVDSLFITALLTVIGFSVHDTIVVFDRIRENNLRHRFDSLDKVVNYSLLQTLARSINTSLTVIFTLLALFLFGGASIHSFVLALLIGIVSGTYSSIFNASLLLVVWEHKEWRNWFGRGGRTATTETRARTA